MNFFQTLTSATSDARNHLLTAPVVVDALDGRVTRATYLAFLSQAYHHVRHTVPLLMACGARMPDRLNWLQLAVAEYIGEELGHEQWILDDIDAAGGDAEAVRRSRPVLATDVMVAYAWDVVTRRNPVGFFGMVLVLEGTSVAVATQVADAVQPALGLPTRAFRYLRSHGALDQGHLSTFAGLMNRLDDPADQDAVLTTANAMYHLYRGVFDSLPRFSTREAA